MWRAPGAAERRRRLRRAPAVRDGRGCARLTGCCERQVLPSDSAPHELRQVCLNVLEQHLPGESADRPVLVAAGERCLMDLGGWLAVVFGIEGDRALLERALRLTADEFPTLAAAHPRTRPPGRVAGLQRSVRHLPPEQAKQALALTLANVAWLLTQLIGGDLCLHLLRQVWPDISGADLEQPRAGAAATALGAGVGDHEVA